MSIFGRLISDLCIGTQENYFHPLRGFPNFRGLIYLRLRCTHGKIVIYLQMPFLQTEGDLH
jgi:hypothetical protein